eukprot:1137392-Pelagomonas_calceolata.AAC.1
MEGSFLNAHGRSASKACACQAFEHEESDQHKFSFKATFPFLPERWGWDLLQDPAAAAAAAAQDEDRNPVLLVPDAPSQLSLPPSGHPQGPGEHQ